MLYIDWSKQVNANPHPYVFCLFICCSVRAVKGTVTVNIPLYRMS